ncbi:acetyl-CoA hydrolase/transferase C-terminal domain-containing protein [Bacillus sp. B15-48]|uniref:acetyl-CoA hydrolase/transferase family protein n=1 Tax=Bacillus sp. B15-48 TaxID=1548601 RepID=UPI00193F2180|nr:acetyl-CoA hydrolase/transferase C-terminal domain-containing protein [Bacillus sp. B15-48]MBM4765137.1 propionyl-CoA--succinate CoA transferase [Bacillus sp. B15-48]
MNRKEKSLHDILNLIEDDADLIIPLGNGEPDIILSAIDENPHHFTALRIHQMFELRDRNYMHGQYPHIQYFSYFMNAFARQAFSNGTCELVPNHFHQMPMLLEKTTKKPFVICQASPMDNEGFFTLGTEADYAAYFIGKVPFILQVNKFMPHTHGETRIHLSQILGFIHHDAPLVEIQSPPITETDMKIAEYIAERINDGSTLQVGIGGIPNAVASLLKNHRNLGIHTEMLTDGIAELAKAGIVTGMEKNTHIGKIVASFALGSKDLYDFMDDNDQIEMLPVHYVNDPRVIAREDQMTTINATTEIDFYGQCASETVAGKYYSSTGGQADFGTGVQFSKNGKGFICMHSTAKNGTISRIRPMLAPGSVVTTSKNDIDYVVTEYGISRLKGKSISQRTEDLIKLAHPNFRDELRFEAKKLGFIY